jgi:hypothetical protein
VSGLPVTWPFLAASGSGLGGLSHEIRHLGCVFKHTRPTLCPCLSASQYLAQGLSSKKVGIISNFIVSNTNGLHKLTDYVFWLSPLWVVLRLSLKQCTPDPKKAFGKQQNMAVSTLRLASLCIDGDKSWICPSLCD